MFLLNLLEKINTNQKAHLVERDIATITAAVSNISSSLTQLQSKVQAFQGVDQVADLNTASTNVLSALNSGTAAAQGSAALSLTDALGLQDPIKSLGTTVDGTINALTAKKPAFDQAGISPVVADQLNQQRDASNKFATTVTSKVPAAAQEIAKNLAQPIQDSLNKGVAAFSGNSTTASSTGNSSNSTVKTPSSPPPAAASAASPKASSGTAGCSRSPRWS